ncbi:hypothetical protein M0R45_036515 [Rubus argutus]|uniref:Uncharacterized protein n=1 Tax=Rubus argutus TaxID=59490 RepID=A0AAW1VZ23_RUBAR
MMSELLLGAVLWMGKLRAGLGFSVAWPLGYWVDTGRESSGSRRRRTRGAVMVSTVAGSTGLGIAKQPWVAAVERCGGALIEAMVAW